MKTKPNIVIVMTDQHRADHSAREGFPLDTTPYLDRLAGQGVWFDKAYTCAPVCLPARISMLTGRWPSATRIRHNSYRMPAEHSLYAPLYEKDLFDIAEELGYRTAMCGKNHSHLTPERVDFWSHYSHSAGYGRSDSNAQEKDFDRYLKGLKHSADFNPAPFPVECQGPYRAVRDALEWIDSDPDRPFFLWLTFAEPHNPYQVPKPYFDLFPPTDLPPLRSSRDAWKERGFKWRFTRQIGERAFADYERQIDRARSNYLGMLRLIDDQVKRFVKHLEARGEWENTIMVFVADHGDFVGEYGLVRKGPEIPDYLMRIPLFWIGRGIKRTKNPHPAHVSIVDLMPTLCEALEVPLPHGVQGRSLWPLLTGGEYPEEEFSSIYGEQGMGGLHFVEGDTIIDPTEDGLSPGNAFDELNSRSQSGTMRMLREGDWKLDFDMQGKAQLYNLKDDPGELNNLFGSPKTTAIERELLADLLAWSLRAQDPLPLPNLRYRMKRDPRNYWAPYRET